MWSGKSWGMVSHKSSFVGEIMWHGESYFEFNRTIIKETQLSNPFAIFSCLLWKAKDDNYIDENIDIRDEKCENTFEIIL